MQASLFFDRATKEEREKIKKKFIDEGINRQNVNAQQQIDIMLEIEKLAKEKEEQQSIEDDTKKMDLKMENYQLDFAIMTRKQTMFYLIKILISL